MRKLVTTCFAAVLLASSPAWAGGGHGHGKHWDKHAEKRWKKERKHWAKHHRHDREVIVVHQAPRVVEHHYTYVQPRVVYAPPPGIHVVMPNLYVPF